MNFVMIKLDLRKCDLEALLNILQYLHVLFVTDEGDGQALGTESASTAHSVKVRVGVNWHVVIDGQVDSLNVDTTTENVSCHANTLVELFELAVSFNAELIVSCMILS